MLRTAIILSVLVFGTVGYADDTVTETAKEVANDSKRAVKSGARTVKDKTCEMINGKMECAVQKAKHAVQNGADKVEDAID